MEYSGISYLETPQSISANCMGVEVSTQSKETCDDHDHDNQAYNVNNRVHEILPNWIDVQLSRSTQFIPNSSDQSFCKEKHVRQSLKKDGTWMVVEPAAGDSLEANMNPVGRIYYSASTMICVPTSLAQETGLALGAQAGEERIADVIRSGGFKHVKRVAETPLNMVLQAT